MAFKVRSGLIGSSKEYRICKEGRAVINKINTGTTVQVISILCSWSRSRSVNLYKVINTIAALTRAVIRVKTHIVKSWKKISCSIEGEVLS